MTLVVILLVVVVVAAIVLFVVRRRSSADSSVDSFRRHIDALGPEARRSVVDQVQNAAGRNPANDEPIEPSGHSSPAEPTQAAGDVTDAVKIDPSDKRPRWGG